MIRRISATANGCSASFFQALSPFLGGSRFSGVKVAKPPRARRRAFCFAAFFSSSLGSTLTVLLTPVDLSLGHVSPLSFLFVLRW